MAGITTNSAARRVSAPAQDSYQFALIALTSLFFMWGFITCLNDILVPHLKNVFQLNYAQSMLIQFCFFGAYFIVSLPAGALVKRIGYKWGIVVGLVIAAIGCALFIPAASYRVYALFLGALFVLATGITILQVAANPYVTVLGAPDTAASRLTLTQAFNSLGTTLAPIFGALLILSAATVAVEQRNARSSSTRIHAGRSGAVKFPYLILAVAFLVLAVIFAALKLPDVEGEEDRPADPRRSVRLAVSPSRARRGRHLPLRRRRSEHRQLPGQLPQPAAISPACRRRMRPTMSPISGAARWSAASSAPLSMRYVDDGKALAFNALIAAILLLTTVTGDGPCRHVGHPRGRPVQLDHVPDDLQPGAARPRPIHQPGFRHPVPRHRRRRYPAGYPGRSLPTRIGIHLAFLMPILCYAYIAYLRAQGSQAQPETTGEFIWRDQTTRRKALDPGHGTWHRGITSNRRTCR